MRALPLVLLLWSLVQMYMVHRTSHRRPCELLGAWLQKEISVVSAHRLRLEVGSSRKGSSQDAYTHPQLCDAKEAS
eukprot:1524448-Amphidinium_carterae.2